jgi:hypothetical protein
MKSDLIRLKTQYDNNASIYFNNHTDKFVKEEFIIKKKVYNNDIEFSKRVANVTEKNFGLLPL